MTNQASVDKLFEGIKPYDQKALDGQEIKLLINEQWKDANLMLSIRHRQISMTPEERVLFWCGIQNGYCKDCGTDKLPCYCGPQFDE